MGYLAKGKDFTTAEVDIIQDIVNLGSPLQYLRVNAAGTGVEWATVSSGTVTSVSVVTANGVSGSVATATTTPAITLTLGAITPSSVTSAGVVKASANDGAALGESGTGWSDAFFASGAVINFAAGDVTLTHGSNVLTLGGGDLALGANSLTMTGSIAATGARVTKGWFTDVESSNMYTVGGTSLASTFSPIAGSASIVTVGTITSGAWNGTDIPVTAGGTGLSAITALSIWLANSANTITEVTPGAGNSIRVNGAGTAWEAFTPSAVVPTTITVANEATDTSCSILFVTAATGDLGPKSNAGLTFNSNTAVLTATGFVGPLTGNVTGDVSGTAATVTGAAQAAITSVGTLTILAVDNITIDLNTISSTAGTDLLITPLAGQQLILDGTIIIDAGEVLGITSLGVTGTRVTAGFFTDLTVTNAIAGSITGTAAVATTATAADEATDTSCFITFVTAATGNLGIKTNANLTLNSNTGVVTFASSVLTTTDINGGTVDGAVIGGASAAAITGTVITANTSVVADADGGAALGSATVGFSILGLSSGSTINFANSNVVITHSSGILTVGTGELRNTNAGTNTASVVTVGGTQTLTAKTLTAPTINAATLSGIITLAESTSIALDPAQGDGTWTGITRAGTAGATLAFGQLCYLAAADSRWELADADAATTADRMLGMCVLAAAADGDPTVMLLMGNIQAASQFPAMTIGSAMYVGETAGAIQVAIPTGADNVIRRVGYALTADEIYFNPSMDSQTTVA